jgi:flagellar hook assembly protein FlgD
VLNVSGSGINGIVISDTLPAQVNFVSFGSSPAGTATTFISATSQLQWTLPSPLSSSTTLTYETQVKNFTPCGNIANLAQMTYPGLAAPVTSSVNVQTTCQFTVQIGVYNGAGELIKTIPTQQFSQPIENITLQSSNAITALNGQGSTVGIYYQGVLIGTWDGSTNSGGLATNGEYYVKIDNIDETGVVKSVTQQVMVSRSLYKATILIYNEAGEVVRHLYTYVSDPGPSDASGVSLTASVIQPTNGSAPGGVPTQVSIILSNGTTVTWDGTGDNGNIVANGQYLVEVHTVDGNGGETVLTAQVAVLGGHSGNVATIQAEPNVLTRATGYTTTIVDNSGLNLTLTVHLYTTAGELVFQKTQTGNPGSGQVTLDASGLASGLYLATVDAVNAKGGIVDHSILKIAVFH